MSKKTGYLLGILLTIIIGIILNWWLCCGVQADQTARMDDNLENQNPAEQAALNEDIALNDPESGMAVSEEPSEELNQTLERIQADPLAFYFETAKSTLILHPDQLQKIADIRYYLENTDGATLLLTGHTDNTGSLTINMKLGQDRALAAKEYLVSNSIPEGSIMITSEGPNNPVASNASLEGRAKNRRTVVTIN